MTDALTTVDSDEVKVETHKVSLPSDIEGILDAVRDILKRGHIQSIHLEKDEPIVYTRIAGVDDGHPFEGSRSYEDLPIGDIIRHRPVDEMPPFEGKLSGAQQLVRSMVYMELRDLVVTHAVVGPGTLLWKWLSIDPLITHRVTHICGAKIEIDKTLDPQRVVLCGARTRSALKSELEYSIVIFMEPE